MDHGKRLQWILTDQANSQGDADGSDTFVSPPEDEPQGGSVQPGMGFSAPYLQWLDITAAYEAQSLDIDEIGRHVAELEDYLWDHFERLEAEDSNPSGLMREGLLRLIQLCEKMGELGRRAGDLKELGNWEGVAYEANQLLLQGYQEALKLARGET